MNQFSITSKLIIFFQVLHILGWQLIADVNKRKQILRELLDAHKLLLIGGNNQSHDTYVDQKQSRIIAHVKLNFIWTDVDTGEHFSTSIYQGRYSAKLNPSSSIPSSEVIMHALAVAEDTALFKYLSDEIVKTYTNSRNLTRLDPIKSGKDTTAKMIFKQLVLGDFPQRFINNIYSGSLEQDIYVVAMDEMREPNKNYNLTKNNNGKIKTCFCHDAIMSFIPGRSMYECHNRNHHISIEIKREKRDIIRDDKIQQYLGAVDYCFIAVPEGLLWEGVNKIRSFSKTGNDKYIGLINASNGDIVIMPQIQKEIQIEERRNALLARMHAQSKWLDNPAEVYCPHKHVTGGKPDSFIERGGVSINVKYKKLWR